MEDSKSKKAWWKAPLYVFIGLVVFTTIVPRILSDVSKDEIQEMAYNDVLEELRAENNPTGMLGVTWYMSQQDVKNLFNDYSQLDDDTLVRSAVLYERPIQAAYSFQDDKLIQVIASFKGEVKTLEEMSDLFYATQEHLSSEYGEMPEPTVNEIIPPNNGTWTDQSVLVSKKKMGRTTLVHQIIIKDNSAGEQIYMYLSAE